MKHHYKKILIAFFFSMQFSFLNAQWVTIPDTNFVNWLNTNGFGSCMSGNLMDTTCNTVINAVSVNCFGQGIKNLDGIQYFDLLDTLFCDGNNLYFSGFPVLHAPLRRLSCTGCVLTTLPVLPPTITHLDCSQNALTSITSFPDSLTNLYCYTNQLTSLPPLPSGLTEFQCNNNQLTSFPSLPPGLLRLYAENNQLTSLPALPSTMTWLSVQDNQLTNLPALPVSLTVLYCFNNQIASLPSLPPDLIWLHCYNNQLTSLPSLPVLLKSLGCDDNQINMLPPLPDSLYGLGCANNLLNSLPQLPDSLLYLTCNGNQLTSLPALPIKMTDLHCQNNLLTVLPPLPSTLRYLYCNNNLLTSLPVLPPLLYVLMCNDNQLTSLPALPSGLYYLYCENNQISCFPVIPANVPLWHFDITPNPFTCLPNYTAAMDSTLLVMPLCADNDVIGNPNACPAIKGVFGYTYQDLNSNCVMGSSDGFVNNIPIQLYDSAGALIKTFYTLNNGAYNYILDSGAYTIVIDTAGKPYTFNCNSPGLDSAFTLTTADPLAENINFEIGCKPGFDVGAQSVHTTGMIFPGIPHELHVAAGNISLWNNLNCASGISGTVVITVNGPVTYDSIPADAWVPTNIINNIFTYSIADFGTLNLNAFAIWFTTNTSAQTGSLICVSVDVIPLAPDNDSTNNQLSFCYRVVNSVDPNDKQVYPDSVVAPYNNYFTYTIRFQNTGTAPAQNIRITDTLDSHLDLSTFEIINYSHANTSTLTDNIATFRFPAIQLPDSATDAEGSKGFIQYRIKPIASLSLGTQINNTAHIYFDYNVPVATNNAQSNYVTAVSIIGSNPQAPTIKLFPNPVTNNILKINFQSPDNTSMLLVLYDLTGRKVFSDKINSAQAMQTIFLPKLANGIYTCELSTADFKESTKLVIIDK